MNNSLVAESPGLLPSLIVLRTCLITVLGLLIIFGNILCIAVTRRVSNLADSTKVLMTSLAVYDLLVGLLALFNIIASALDRWPFGEVVCKIISCLESVCLYMSVISIIFLNVERYIAVTRPYKFPVWCSRRHVTIIQLVASFCAGCSAISIPFWPNASVKYFKAPAVCFFENASGPINALILLAIVIGPTLTMVCIYCRMIKVSWEHVRRMGAKGQNQANKIRDNKALKTFLMVTLIFAGCYAPLLTARTVEGYRGLAVPCWLEVILIWMPVSNSAFNVFVYCLFNQVYRHTARRILMDMFRCCKRPDAPVNM